MKNKLNWSAILEFALPVIVFFGIFFAAIETHRYFEWRDNPPKLKQQIEDHKTNGAVSVEVTLENLSKNDILWARRQGYSLGTNQYIGASGRVDCLVVSW